MDWDGRNLQTLNILPGSSGVAQLLAPGRGSLAAHKQGVTMHEAEFQGHESEK